MKDKYIYMFICFAVAFQAMSALAKPEGCEAEVIASQFIDMHYFGQKPLQINVNTRDRKLTVYKKQPAALNVIFRTVRQEYYLADFKLQNIPIAANRALTPSGTFNPAVMTEHLGRGMRNVIQLEGQYHMRSATSVEQCLINSEKESLGGEILVPHDFMVEIFALIREYGLDNTEIVVRPPRRVAPETKE